MKKIFILTALLMTGTLAQAQDLSLGAGYLYSTLTSQTGNTKESNEVTSGAYLGGSFNIPIVGELGLAPGLYYSILTGQGTGSYLDGLVQGRVKFAEHAINLPVYLNYGMELGHADLFIFAGPTFQYGISSKYKFEGSIPLVGFGAREEIDSYKDLSMGRFNIYMGGGLGVDLNELIRVTVGFDYGLLDLDKSDENCKQYRYNFKVGVAYLFD